MCGVCTYLSIYVEVRVQLWSYFSLLLLRTVKTKIRNVGVKMLIFLNEVYILYQIILQTALCPQTLMLIPKLYPSYTGVV